MINGRQEYYPPGKVLAVSQTTSLAVYARNKLIPLEYKEQSN
jgi:hypothetical protein